MLTVEKPVSMHAQAGGPRMRQAGALHMDGQVLGQNNHQTGWRAGEADGWTIDGSAPARSGREPPADIQHQAAWRYGDTSGFSFDGSSAPVLAPQLREGGVGRRTHPALQPYNDGSQLAMQAALTDQRERARRQPDAYQLSRNGASLHVESVTKAERERVLREQLENADQKATWREHLWDKRPFALDNNPDLPEQTHGGHSAPRRSTDVTAGGVVSASEADRIAIRRMAEQVAPSTEWRLGDDLPFTVDGAPARMHDKHLDPNQGAWRMGDTRPFRVDGSAREDDWRALDRANRTQLADQGYNARRNTDIVYHSKPDLINPRRAAEVTLSPSLSGVKLATVDELYNGASEARFGPRAAVLPDVNAGLSWGEMRRRGMLGHSASDTVLLPAKAKGIG